MLLGAGLHAAPEELCHALSLYAMLCHKPRAAGAASCCGVQVQARWQQEPRGPRHGAGSAEAVEVAPGRAQWSSPWCPGSSPGIVLPPGTIAGSQGTSCDPTRSTAPRCHQPLSPIPPSQLVST